jgi:hypothetical protein
MTSINLLTFGIVLLLHKTSILYFSVSGITFIRYAQSQAIGRSNNLKVLGARKPKGLYRITIIS